MAVVLATGLLLINDSFTFLLYLLEIKGLSNPWCCFFAMSVCAFNSLPKGEYSNLFIVAAFSSKNFSGKTFFLIKNLYSLTFTDKAEILAFCLFKSY